MSSQIELYLKTEAKANEAEKAELTEENAALRQRIVDLETYASELADCFLYSWPRPDVPRDVGFEPGCESPKPKLP